MDWHRETILKTMLIVSVVLENCEGERAKRLRIRVLSSTLPNKDISEHRDERVHGNVLSFKYHLGCESTCVNFHLRSQDLPEKRIGKMARFV